MTDVFFPRPDDMRIHRADFDAMNAQADSFRATIARLEAEKAAVLEIHKPVQRHADDPTDLRCVECDWDAHPCATARALGVTS